MSDDGARLMYESLRRAMFSSRVNPGLPGVVLPPKIYAAAKDAGLLADDPDDEPCEFCGRTLADGPCDSCAEDDPNG